MKSKKTFWFVVAIAVGIYAVMVAWSLPKIIADAGGLEPFDLRPFGYSFQEAKTFLSALSPAGTAFYLDVQQRLDMVFPFVEMLAVGWAIFLLVPERWRKFAMPMALIALPGMVFDYLENFKVAQMLKSGAKSVSQQMVETASFYTVAKSIGVSVAMLLLLALIVAWFVRRKRGK